MGDLAPIVAAQRAPAADAIEVVLTLPASKYGAFARDLEELREKTGAASNTQAVVEAVRRSAAE